MTEEEALMAPGTTGLLWDETPALHTAHVRPFVWAVLMYRGACRPSEVVAAISQVCSVEDLKAGMDDEEDERSHVEIVVESLERLSCGTTSNHVHHWGFHFGKVSFAKERSQIVENAITSVEDLLDWVVKD